MEGREINEQGVERNANGSKGGNVSETWRRDLRTPMRWAETNKVTERDGAALGHSHFQMTITSRSNVQRPAPHRTAASVVFSHSWWLIRQQNGRSVFFFKKNLFPAASFRDLHGSECAGCLITRMLHARSMLRVQAPG